MRLGGKCVDVSLFRLVILIVCPYLVVGLVWWLWLPCIWLLMIGVPQSGYGPSQNPARHPRRMIWTSRYTNRSASDQCTTHNAGNAHFRKSLKDNNQRCIYLRGISTHSPLFLNFPGGYVPKCSETSCPSIGVISLKRSAGLWTFSTPLDC